MSEAHPSYMVLFYKVMIRIMSVPPLRCVWPAVTMMESPACAKPNFCTHSDANWILA
jgi:hypothetical protein